MPGKFLTSLLRRRGRWFVNHIPHYENITRPLGKILRPRTQIKSRLSHDNTDDYLLGPHPEIEQFESR